MADKSRLTPLLFSDECVLSHGNDRPCICQGIDFPGFFRFSDQMLEPPWRSGRFCFAFYYSNCFFNVSRRAIETKMPIFIYKNKYLFLQALQENFLLDILMHLILPPMSCQGQPVDCRQLVVLHFLTEVIMRI